MKFYSGNTNQVCRYSHVSNIRLPAAWRQTLRLLPALQCLSLYALPLLTLGRLPALQCLSRRSLSLSLDAQASARSAVCLSLSSLSLSLLTSGVGPLCRVCRRYASLEIRPIRTNFYLPLSPLVKVCQQSSSISRTADKEHEHEQMLPDMLVNHDPGPDPGGPCSCSNVSFA